MFEDNSRFFRLEHAVVISIESKIASSWLPKKLPEESDGVVVSSVDVFIPHIMLKLLLLFPFYLYRPWPSGDCC